MSENTSTEIDFAVRLFFIVVKKSRLLTMGSVTSNGLLSPFAAKWSGNSFTEPAPKRITVGKLYCLMILKSVIVFY